MLVVVYVDSWWKIGIICFVSVGKFGYYGCRCCCGGVWRCFS
ncbi:hypothetical protein SLEP1_g44821 [Rubroshorea leprosula]|uniref:Transmembrane protein n=1 Tax=Rubroshorea leprosula TaxID=152421 RepID=A0AAV5LHS8_9ROSI|nr:hypothetical protein SLEP1_g44821 [Rubroshorea leprosula]